MSDRPSFSPIHRLSRVDLNNVEQVSNGRALRKTRKGYNWDDRRREGKSKARSAANSIAKQAVKAYVPGGALIPDSMISKATGKALKRVKWIMLKPIIKILLVVILVLYIYLSNVYVDPNYINVNAYLNKSYSRDTTFQVILSERYINGLRDELEEYKEDNKGSEDSSVPATPANRNGLSTSRFSADFVTINNYLLSYCSTYGSIKVDIGKTPIDMDGLFYMTMCNTESGGWAVDYSKTLSSVYPSAFLDINIDNYKERINSVGIVDVLISEDAYKPNAYNYTWAFKPWVGDPLTQGPSTQWFSNNSGVSSTCEYDKISAAREVIEKAMVASQLYNETEAATFYELIASQCTGSGFDSTGMTGNITKGKIGDFGDRWCIKDQCQVFSKTQSEVFANLKEVYPSTETASPYEVIALARMNHWLPSVCFSDAETYYKNKESKVAGWYENWGHYQSWIAYAKILSTEPVIEEIRSQVLTNVADNKFLVDECDIDAVLAIAGEQSLTYDNGYDSPFEFSIDDECLTGQAKKEFIKYLYNYILLETLYSEGGATE